MSEREPSAKATAFAVKHWGGFAGPRDCALAVDKFAAQAVEREQEQFGWRLIETAPKDGTRIHLGFLGMKNFDVVGHWERGMWRLSADDEYGIAGRPSPTHWRFLPEPPARPVP